MTSFLRTLLLVGSFGLIVLRVDGATWYVATNGDDAADGASWFTAKQTIQAAIDEALSNDTVLVSNGVYATGGRVVYGTMTNRVAITNAIAVQSVNGPEVTIIQGTGPRGVSAVRCVYVGDHAMLSGFTLTNGNTRNDSDDLVDVRDAIGGGALCGASAILSNCVLIGNSAYSAGGGVCGAFVAVPNLLIDCTLADNSAHDFGGGASWSTLSNCVLFGNTGGGSGGGADNCILYSCTLTSNSATDGGGASLGTLYDCTLTGNSAGRSGGGVEGATLRNCTLVGNSATNGGGSWAGALYDCILSNNSAVAGGGAYDGSLYNCAVVSNSAKRGGGIFGGVRSNCLISGNTAFNEGGGAYEGALYNCTLSGNSANLDGGGAYGSLLLNCCVVSNSAVWDGGGTCLCALSNCILNGNSANNGGGARLSGSRSLYNCTIIGNSASQWGGGVSDGEIHNCIVYFNTAPNGPNFFASSLDHSCTTPDPGGTGNITNDPEFVDTVGGDFRLAAGSLCIDKGDNSFVHGANDLDGNPRIVHGIVDMGAYEFQGYWAWAGVITNGLTNSGDCATGDGYPNLLKYVTGSSPTNSDELARLLGGCGSGPLFLFNRNTNALDVTLIVEGSDSVSNGAAWNGIATNINGLWGGATNVSESGASTPVRVTVQDSDPDMRTNRFIRLRVSRP